MPPHKGQSLSRGGAIRKLYYLQTAKATLILPGASSFAPRQRMGIYQRRGEDGPTSAHISAPRGRAAFAPIRAMVLGSSRDAEHRFPPPFHAFTDTIRILLYVQHR